MGLGNVSRDPRAGLPLTGSDRICERPRPFRRLPELPALVDVVTGAIGPRSAIEQLHASSVSSRILAHTCSMTNTAAHVDGGSDSASIARSDLVNIDSVVPANTDNGLRGSRAAWLRRRERRGGSTLDDDDIDDGDDLRIDE